MKKSYFSSEGLWLKGNTHSHSTVSDGCYSPLELAKLYEEKGYDFLSMTDHNVFVPHNELPEEKLLLLTGVEHDIDYRSDKCTHIVGLGAKSQSHTSYECRKFKKEELSDQQMADMMAKDGQFVSLAHPVWSHMEIEEIMELENLNAIEVYNNGTEHLAHGGNAELIWEYLLRRGRKIFAIASDDVHVPEDLFGGWIWLKAEERSKEAVLKALFEGQFYASTGPEIYDFGIEDGEAYLSCSPCRAIHFVSFMPRGKSYFAKDGKLVKEARHSLSGDEAYIRAVCEDKNGHSAWTQPIYFKNK